MVMPSNSTTPTADQTDSMSAAQEDRLVYDILKSLPVAFCHTHITNQRLLMVNDHMCQATGYSKEELLSMKPMEILSPESQKVLDRRLQAMAAGEPVSKNVDFEIVTKSGAHEWCQCHIHHIREEGRITNAYVVAYSIADQKRAQKKIDNHRQKLQKLVEERTCELARINRQLRDEIEQRVKASEALRANGELLEEMNTAMRVLLDKRQEDRLRAEELIRMNLKEFIDPYLERLENSDLRSHQRQLVEVIRTNLGEMLGSAILALSSKYIMFSPSELQVVNLIRSGKTTKEMARLMNLSTRTIETYRNSIRKKLDLKNKPINLRTYLMPIQ
jgi:PAS domain S-box-containing protein